MNEDKVKRIVEFTLEMKEIGSHEAIDSAARTLVAGIGFMDVPAPIKEALIEKMETLIAMTIMVTKAHVEGFDLMDVSANDLTPEENDVVMARLQEHIDPSMKVKRSTVFGRPNPNDYQGFSKS